MVQHELKTWPPFFADLLSGVKTFEVRYNDRNFQVGDLLVLQEMRPPPPDESSYIPFYTGREIRGRITYVLPGNQFGIQDGYVVLGIRVMTPRTVLEDILTSHGQTIRELFEPVRHIVDVEEAQSILKGTLPTNDLARRLYAVTGVPEWVWMGYTQPSSVPKPKLILFKEF